MQIGFMILNIRTRYQYMSKTYTNKGIQIIAKHIIREPLEYKKKYCRDQMREQYIHRVPIDFEILFYWYVLDL